MTTRKTAKSPAKKAANRTAKKPASKPGVHAGAPETPVRHHRPGDVYDRAFGDTPIFCETLADLADAWPRDAIRPKMIASIWAGGLNS